MRKVVGAVALLFLLALFSLSIPATAPAPGEPPSGGLALPAQFAIRSAEIADSGGAKVALLHLDLFSGQPANITAFCSQKPLQNNVLILSHAAVPGTDRGIAGEVASSLSRSGLSSRTARIGDALSSQNALIISTAGAIPAGLAGNASLLQESNSRVVALVSLPGKSIGEDGGISQMDSSLPENFEAVRISPSGLRQAVADAASSAVFPPGAKLEKSEAHGNFTVAIPVDWPSAYCRAVSESAGGLRRFMDSGLLQAPPGALLGPAKAPAGSEAEFEFSLPGNEELGRSLVFFAEAHSPSGMESSQEIAGGNISKGWTSRFSASFQRGGKYSLRVIDQFGRVHASALVRVPSLEAKQMSQEGSRYEFSVLLDGKMASGQIEARLGNGTPRNYSVQNGSLVIWADPGQGGGQLILSMGGASAGHPLQAGQPGLGAFIDSYIRLGLPSAFFLLAVFLLLRAGKKARYSITFPQVAQIDPGIMEVGAKEALGAYSRADRKLGGFRLPCTAHEIAGQLGNPSPSPQSVLRVLRALSGKGVFAEHEGAFVPSGKTGGFTAAELSILRTIHECMLERGMRFARKPIIAAGGNELEIALFRGKASMLAKIGKACRAVVFESPEGRREFEEGLSEPSAENTRIRLALGNDKVFLVAASRNELSAILP